MLRLAVFLALFVLTKTEDLLGVDYSFDADFFTNFNSTKCDNENMWRIVSYRVLDIDPPYADSDKGIQAVGESCASSFPIIFVGGSLEFYVYYEEFSQYFNLMIEVFDDKNRSITRYKHQPSYEFDSGWQKISLKINKHVKGYINLRGRSLKNEILLVDSFKYRPNDTITYSDKRYKRSIDFENNDDDEIIFDHDLDESLYETETFESSGDDEVNTEEPPLLTEQPDTDEPEGRHTFWNPFTISLVSFGVVVIVAIFIVSAYHCGKIKAMDNDPLPFVEEEPPRTVVIPRATGRSNPISRLGFHE